MTPGPPPSPPAPGPRAAAPGASGAAPPVVVRRAGVEDVGQAAVLFDAYRQFYGAASDVAGARTFLAARLARGESVVLLASPVLPRGVEQEPAGSGAADAIGFAQLYPSFSSVSLGAVVTLNDLFVEPSSRRAGVARSLVEAAAASAAHVGAIRLELATQFTNTPACRLYASLGFAPDLTFAHLSLALDTAGSVEQNADECADRPRRVSGTPVGSQPTPDPPHVPRVGMPASG